MNRAYLILLVILSSGPAFGEDLGCGVETIPKDQIEYGCGCGFYKETKPEVKTIMQTEMNFESPKMYIGGKLVNLTPVKVENIPDSLKLGDKFSQTYKYNDMEIKFTNTISFLCPSDSEGGCEVTEFNTVLTFSNKQCKSQSLKITGDCGC